MTAEGAFSVAFVPLYSEALETRGRTEADRFAGNTFMVMLSVLSAFTLLAMLVMPLLVRLIAPGFEVGQLRYDTAIELTRITFPYLLFMSLTALLGGVLNALDRFAPFAFAPVLFNICLIAALLLSGLFESAGHALSYGILAAGLLQLAFLCLCAVKAGVRLQLSLPRFDGDIKRVLSLMGPGVIGAGVMHINLFADMIIASFLEGGSISYLYYADRLNQLPLGIVGIAVGTALLPMLSKAVASGEGEKAAGLYNRALEYCFLLALPAALALGAFSNLIISVLFERGAFDASDSAVSAAVLSGYVVGLPAYIAIKVFSTVHWAHKDTVTPVKIAVVSTVCNILLSLFLIQYIGAVGISLATGLTGWLQFMLHIRAVKLREGFNFDRELKINLVKIFLGSAAMICVSYSVYMFAALYLDKFLSLGLVVLSGVLSYGVFVILSGAIDIKKFCLRKMS